MSKYIISGNTFEHREEIARQGAIWNKEKKVWVLDVIEKGFKRNDSAIYYLKKLSGLKIEKEKV